ncbi:MAG: AAA family ATPase [Elusimicrobiota bacterium]
MDQLWIEKYRPNNLNDIVGQKKIITKIKDRVNNGGITHMLFSGRPGVGKTATANAIAKELDTDIKELNASDERGIDIVRSTIKDFCRHSFTPDRYKIMFLDEADGLTPESQDLLRRTMEKYSHTTRFILCANNKKKIIEALQSRCKDYDFKPIEPKEIAERLDYIAQKEGLNMNEKQLKAISDNCKGDLRKAINMLQNRDYPEEEKDDFDKILDKY